MSRQITQPVNQVRLTNVAVVRMNRHGKRFEVACYRNKILNYRQGIETDLSEVLQTDRVFTNVSKGLFAPSKDLKLAFDTADQEQCCRFILDKGQIQVSDMERSATLENTAREVANMVATKCVHPISNRPYTTNQIRDAMKKSEFSVQPTSARSVKQQFLDCVRLIQDKGVLEIQRAKMELAIFLPDERLVEEVKVKLRNEAQALIHTNTHGQRVEFFIDPSKFRAVDSIAKKYGTTLEIMRQIVTQEGDVEVSLELERNTVAARHIQQEQNIQSNTSVTQEGMKSNKLDTNDLGNDFGDLHISNAPRPYLNDSDDDDNENYGSGLQPQISSRKKNKKAMKKSKKAKRREKEEASVRQERKEAEQARRKEREERLNYQKDDVCPEVGSAAVNKAISDGSSSRKSCNTCGGDFSPAEYRAHFRSDWHRYNMKLKLKGLAPIDEKEFQMFADDFF